MACRGFLQCLLKLFNLALALVGVLLLVFSISLLVKQNSPLTPPPPLPPPSAPPPSVLPPSTPLPPAHSLGAAILRLHASASSSNQLQNPTNQNPTIQNPTNLEVSRKLSVGIRNTESSSNPLTKDSKLPALWFTYLLIGAGAYITLLTLVGAVAAESNIVCCLSTYQFGLCFLLLLQLIGGMMVWLEEVPSDPTGEYDKRRQFVEDNLELCKLALLFLLLVEGTALLLAMMLRAIQVDENSAVDDEDDYLVVPRSQLMMQQHTHQRRLSYSQPLLPQNQTFPRTPTAMPSQPGLAAAAGGTTALTGTGSSGSQAPGPGSGIPQSDTWRARLMEKYGMDPNELQYSSTDRGGSSPLPLRSAASIGSRAPAQDHQALSQGQACSIL